MPALGQTSDELRLLVWHKAEGDPVAEGDPLFEAETDKTTLEVEAAVSGTLLQVVCAEGETVSAGSVVAWIGNDGDSVPSQAADSVPSQAAEAPSRPTAVEPQSRVRATPAARTLAREHGVDLASLSGSGSGGQVERRDVLAALATEPERPGEAVPKLRIAIANRLERAVRVPQFSVSRTVDARPVLRRLASSDGASITHLLLLKVGAALREAPLINRVWVEDGPRLVQLERCDVGLAIAGEEGVIVATIPEPDASSVDELARTTRRAVDEARSGRLSARFVGPVSVTISNLGMFGVDRFEAIVDPDQTAILAVGRIVERPGVTEEGIGVIPQFELTLTVDHRTADGAEAARFLAAICAKLEE